MHEDIYGHIYVDVFIWSYLYLEIFIYGHVYSWRNLNYCFEYGSVPVTRVAIFT